MQRVLVVEDVAPVRDLVCQVLIRAGYEVHCAEDAQQGLEPGIRLGELDLLLTDIELPGVKGTELFDSLSRHQPELRVLFMSGYSDETVDGTLLAWRQPFLPKPFTAAQLPDGG